METKAIEITATRKIELDSHCKELEELSSLQLALVGGGIGDVVFG